MPQLVEMNRGDARALANKIAQSLMKRTDVCPKLAPAGDNTNEIFDEHVVTETIAEEINSYFGIEVKR
jgi:hypothetical protein